MEFVSKPSIPYEIGGLIGLYLNGAVVIATDRIRPLPDVEGAKTIVVETSEGGLRGEIPPMVAVFKGV
jgi:hypothetical protein